MRTQLRIVAGALRGRKLTCTVSPHLRPTPQMVRESSLRRPRTPYGRSRAVDRRLAAEGPPRLGAGAPVGKGGRPRRAAAPRAVGRAALWAEPLANLG